MLSVGFLIVMLSVGMLSVVMLSVVMQSVVMLCVVMLSFAAPNNQYPSTSGIIDALVIVEAVRCDSLWRPR